ncbi:MAG: T9SS type A sorting domain-containing protein [Ignavibacteriales bacterium]|nr:T9SS type A sorting domain-containing protein [Ignavibacteriales bacterium]
MRRMFTCVLALGVIAALPQNAHASPGGRAGVTLKNTTAGCSCHTSGPASSVLPVITGPRQIYVGQRATYALTVSGGVGAGGGCDIASITGALVPVSPYLKVTSNELVQTATTAYVGSSISYAFTYTAPATAGSDTLYAVGLSSNRTESSGLWNWSPNFGIAVLAPTAVPPVPVTAYPASGSASIPTTVSYRVQVSASSSFSTTLLDTVVADPSQAVRYLSVATKYYWRVNAANSLGAGSWSSAADFTTSAVTLLAGTKTIGGTSPDYATIKAAFKDLNARGTTPPGVTFLIRDGSYFEDSLFIQTSTSGPAAPIIIKPAAGANVVINDSGSAALPFVIKIDSTSNVTIDGSNNGTTSRNLTVNGIGVNVQKGIWINSQSYYTTLKNCIVRAGAATAATYRAIDILPGVATGTNPNFSIVENNLLRNAYTGVRAYGKAAGDSLIGLIIRGNVVDSVANAGVYSSYLAYSQIYNNDLAMLIGSSASMYGIYVGSSCDYVRVYANKVHDVNQLSATSTTAGIYCSVGAATHGGTSVFNNFVSVNPSTAGTGIIYGISMYETSNLYPDTVVYNSVNIYGSSSGIRQSVGIYRASSTGTAGVFFRNNVVQNIRTDAGGAYTAIGKTAATTAMSTDFNDLYVSPTDTSHAIGRINATTPVLYRTLADWRAISGGDSSSISVAPPFVSMTDLHIPNGTTTQIEGRGTPIPGITTDIDGNTRNPLKPDMGADEFNGTTSVQLSAAVPALYALDQNYPNPFNPTTTIGYQIPVRGSVTISVFDVLGKEIRTLVNEQKEAGRYDVSFEAGNFSSGIYFYRIHAGNFVSVKKMFLMK